MKKFYSSSSGSVAQIARKGFYRIRLYKDRKNTRSCVSFVSVFVLYKLTSVRLGVLVGKSKFLIPITRSKNDMGIRPNELMYNCTSNGSRRYAFSGNSVSVGKITF